MNLKKIFQLDDKKDILLVLGTIIAPMTGLRVWKVGPGEVICLLYCSINYRAIKYIPQKDIFFRFWSGFLIASSLGALWGTYKYPGETAAIDLFTWFYLGFISIGTHLILKSKTDKDIIAVLTLISYGSALWYCILYLYSRYVSYYFLGAPLWFAGVRFTGGATNPHQVALLLCLNLIVLAGLIINRKSFRSRVFNGIVFIITFFLLRQTKSTTAIMAVTIGIGSVVWQHFWVHYKDKNRLFITVFFVVSIVILLFGVRLYHAFVGWVAADKNGMDRFDIFSSFPTAILKGPVFGLGPGAHARNGYQEFHNSYLEIAAMSGLVGSLFFVGFTFRLFKLSVKNPVSFGALVSCYVYGLAGFGARRLVYWLVVTLVYELATKSKVKTVVRKGNMEGKIHGASL